MKKKFFLITGSNGRFASILKKKFRDKKNFIFLDKRQLNILDKMKIRKAILRYKPYAIIHLAALSRPMIIHEKNIDHSISTNIRYVQYSYRMSKEKYQSNLFFDSICLSGD